MVQGRKAENFCDLDRHRRAMVGTTVRLGVMQNDIAVRIQLQFSAVRKGASVGARRIPVMGDDPIVPAFAFLVADASGMLHGHAHSETPLESAGVSSCTGIPLVPSNGLCSLLEHLHRGIRIVSKLPVLYLRHVVYRMPALYDRN